MSFGTKYNTRSPAVKRLMREAYELHEPTEQYCAQPLEDNLFEWHFTVRGAADTEFAGGVYHGRILLPPEYPMKPPSIMLLTPNGRFETGQKICLSMSAHHPETWQPSWSIRTVLLAIIGFMPSKGEGAIGALDYSSSERKILAVRSLNWRCTVCCSLNANALPEALESNDVINKEAKEIASQISFKGEKVEDGKDAKSQKSKGIQSNIIVDENEDKTILNDKEESLPLNSTNNAEEDDEPVSRNSDKDDSGTSPNLIRKRIKTDSRQPETTRSSNHNDKESNSGMCSLVLLWIVFIALLLLILRRLCMESITVSKS